MTRHFKLPVKKQTRIQMMVDELGTLDAQIAEMNKRYDYLRERLVRSGKDHVMGVLYIADVTEYTAKSFSVKKARRYLSALQYRKCFVTKPTVRVKLASRES